MKKSDIKNGMHVITNSGKEYLIISGIEADKQTIINTNTIMVRIDGEGWLSFDNYNDDLRYLFNDIDDDDDDTFDIKEVYVPNFYANTLLSVYDTDFFTKVWERHIAKKMTKAEIEAELGYEIEII